MSAYGWQITKDHLYPEHKEGVYSGPGVTGPRSITPRLQRELLTVDAGADFRMYDDDRNLCYEGRIVGDYEGFEPLDDYGTPNAGCTIIQYRNPNTNEWEDL